MIFLAFCILCHVLDVISTNLALSRPNTAEGNKLVAWLMSKLGRFWWVYKLPIIALLIYYHEAAAFFALLHLLYVWVIWNNLKIYGQGK